MSPEDIALIERVTRRSWVFARSMIVAEVGIAELLAAAREEGRLAATVLPRIKTAELCYGQGWTDGYGSALKGVEGPCMPECWAASPVQQLVRDQDPD